MKTLYHVMKPNGTMTNYTAELAEEPGYGALKALIEPYLNGGHLEHVTVLWNEEGPPWERLDMFVDEDGHNKGLPRNERATQIYRNNWFTQNKNAKPEDLPHIVGPAILFALRVWF